MKHKRSSLPTAQDALNLDDMQRIHATCVVLDGVGVLIRGGSGSGKSDLALRLIEIQRARLVADDQVILRRHGDGLIMASPPYELAGMIEVRGVGVVRYPFVERTLVSLVVDLQPVARLERMPEHELTEIMDCLLPLMRLDPTQPSATARLAAAIRLMCGDGADDGGVA